MTASRELLARLAALAAAGDALADAVLVKGKVRTVYSDTDKERIRTARDGWREARREVEGA